MNLFLIALVGYLLGSIPFGLVLTKLAGEVDIRTIGSGNIGATNVLRTGNKKLAAATLLLDALKGTAAVWFGAAHNPDAAMLAGLAAFLGHLYPVWLKFKGGKGVATYLGVLLGLYWPAFVFFAVAWVVVAAVWRYSSAAALAATALTPVFFYVTKNVKLMPLSVVLAILLWWKHRENIKRLLSGGEGKIGQKG